MTDRGRQRWRRVGIASGAATLCVLVVGAAIMASYRATLLDEAERELGLLLTLRRSALETGLEQIQSEMALWSDFGQLKESMGLYAAAFEALGPEARARLRRWYIDDNPFPPGDRYQLLDAGDGSTYTALHAERQPRTALFLENHRYFDVFTIGPDGDVLYTYEKQDDFGTNLLSGPGSDTGLASVFRAARDAADPAYVVVSDLVRYAPSGGMPSIFVASASTSDAGELVGVLAAQVSGTQLSRIFEFTEGMGRSGETYAVGDDLLLRSDSRFTEPEDVLSLTVDTESVRRALSGETGVHRSTDYRNEDVVSAFGILEFQGIRWAIVAEKDVAEILAPGRRLRAILLLTGLVVVVLVGFGALPERKSSAWLRAPDFSHETADAAD
ncbi:MAG: hypothetical protein AMS19_03695 [Gemmatimonas sp. SG8_23]|nr:MAG: hypothetical protein AMS19_03695 [Gemmatimonas sp. SG8_23]